MAMTEDLSVFFSDADFAESVVLDGVPVLGIFDNAPAEVFGMATHTPRLRLPSADAAAVTAASVLLARGVTYRVRPAPQHDGTGVCTLWLERQP